MYLKELHNLKYVIMVEYCSMPWSTVVAMPWSTVVAKPWSTVVAMPLSTVVAMLRQIYM